MPGSSTSLPCVRRHGHHLHAVIRLHVLLASFHCLLQPVAAHLPTPFPSSDALGEWKPARATFYAASDPRDTVDGACGYGDIRRSGYGVAGAVGVSEALFERGQACGACLQVRCAGELRHCVAGASVKLTVTNFCPPNYGLANDAGGHCNPPNHHFLMPIQAFEKIAMWNAGSVPVQYRRTRCVREGGIRFTVDGYGVFHTVLVSNVAGAGAVTAVKVKGSTTGWLPMGRNWGQNWQVNADLRGQPLSFEVTTSDGATLISYAVAPLGWSFRQTYVGKQFQM